jgi:uncharacterized protein YegP (UPF0339 family)
MTLPNRRTALAAIGAALSLLLPVSRSLGQVATPRLRFQITRDTRSGFRWRLKGANNRTIADSGEGYRTKAACRAGIDLVRRGAADASIEDLS